MINITLPCDIGTPIFYIGKYGVSSSKVLAYKLNSDGLRVSIAGGGVHDVSEFGKTIFLLQEEANAMYRKLR